MTPRELERLLAEHPLDSECICKLCDFRRAGGEIKAVPAKAAPEPITDPNLPDPDHTPESFRDFHNELRKYRRRVFIRNERPPVTGYRKPVIEGEVKGKAARKAAKKARVAARKAEQETA